MALGSALLNASADPRRGTLKFSGKVRVMRKSQIYRVDVPRQFSIDDSSAVSHHEGGWPESLGVNVLHRHVHKPTRSMHKCRTNPMPQ